MNWFVHDSSLIGQYATDQEFTNELRELLKLRLEAQVIRERLRCSRTLGQRPATPTKSFREIILSCSDRLLKRLVLEWIDSRGPFLDEDRQEVTEDYFECSGVDVTNDGAGEAARRLLNRVDASTYSFAAGGYDYSPLLVDHGIADDRLGSISLRNIWSTDSLRIAGIDALATINNWAQAINFAKARFPDLIFADYLLGPLQRETFTIQLAENIFSKLSKLQDFLESRNKDGTNSAKNDELIADHFSGEKAWFTDESVTNKRDFEERLTFVDPLNSSVKLFCPFHGKIKTPQYRIHFPWPLLQSEKRLRIVYIGPKLTKN